MAEVEETPEPEGSTTEITRREAAAPDWARKYPPLLTVAMALLIALTVLPSALNLPQSNPQETLEYAPVPPEDDNDSPPQGNLSALGLGSSAGIQGAGAEGCAGPGGPPPPVGRGRADPNFRCSANNQQTLDPLSPPCVPFFEGDNFGSTYKGVKGDEIKLVIYIDGGINYSSGSDSQNRVAPSGQIFDLFKTPKENQEANGKSPTQPEHLTTKGMRVWQAYFNQRFQTYKRRVHFYVVYSADQGRGKPEGRRADAATILNKIDPFAVLSLASEGAEDDFLRAMARKGVLNFGSFGLRPETFFNEYPKLIWSYSPSVEQQAESYTTYICQKVKDKPAVLAGAPYTNQPRKYGIIHTIHENQQSYQALAKLVEEKLKACGVTISARATFDNICLAQDNGDNPDEEGTQLANFRSAGVTTILWPGCISGNYAKTASGSGYLPEWLIMGDGLMDGNGAIVLAQAGAAFDGRAIVVTPQVVEPALQQQRCFQAFREIDKTTANVDVSYVCDDYKNIFQFFVGVQVAGPRLTPTSIDKGFHAIPQRQTGEPTVPACFYLPGDYTCVKDAQVEVWSASERPPGSNQPGCWKSLEGGKRYLSKQWPAGNINAQIKGDEKCNGYSTSVRFNLA